MALMKSISGIRGIFGTDLNPGNLVQFTASFGTWLNGGRVVVGRDSRVTGQICEDIVVATLLSMGCDVIKIGIVPTPTVAMSILQNEAAGGIMISASHNPAEWNALKLMDASGEFLSATEGQNVLDMAETNRFDYKNYQQIGKLELDEEAIEQHIEDILSLPYVHAESIRSAGFRIIADAVNGAGAIALPKLFDRLGLNYTILFGEPDGLFPHNPEPLPENVGAICEAMKKTHYDIGFVVDPDVDRLALIDSEGELFGEENTLAVVTEFMLDQNPGPTAVNLSSSMINDVIAERFGQTCHRAAVGEINVVEKMKEVGAVIGGEGNGGVILPDLHYGRDALVGIVLTLQFLAETNVDSADYRRQLPEFHIVKHKIELSELDGDGALEKAKQVFAGQKQDQTDGLKLFFDQGWVHLRKSNTEPIIRIYAEAKDSKNADALARLIKEKLT